MTPLDDAREIVLAEAVPPFANTSAGKAPVRALETGEAIRIMTGAPIPDGADAVVMVEDTMTDGDHVVVNAAVERGWSVRAAGDDIRAGDVVIPAGVVLRAAHLGVADDGLPRAPGDGKVHWQRVHARFETDGRVHVRTTGSQGSHQLSNSAAANALVSLPDGPGVAAGGDVDVHLLGEW